MAASPCVTPSRHLFTNSCVRASSSSHFRPFSSEDEAALASVLASKPRHVARHIRQSMLQSRRRIVQFRNAVTYLMISLQAKLQRKEMSPEDATIIMQGIMKECVDLRQGDMAHLLFRASIRFRKYGLVIRAPFVRYLYESYRQDQSKDLMKSLADELRKDSAMKGLAVLAYLFSGNHNAAIKLFDEVDPTTLTTEDYCAFFDGLGIAGLHSEVARRSVAVVADAKANSDRLEANKIVSHGVIAARSSSSSLSALLELVKKESLSLTDAAVGAVVRFHLQDTGITTVEEVFRVEARVAQDLGRKTLGVSAETAIVAKCSEVMVRHHSIGDDVMLKKVEHLRSVVETAIKNDALEDLDPLYASSLLRGFGVLGRFEDMRRCFELLQKAGLVRDHKLYDEMMRWYANTYNVKEVVALKEEMTRQNVYHTTLTYCNVFRVLDRYYPKLVEKYLMEMRSRGIQVDGPMYPILIRVFSALNDFTSVEALYKEAKKKASGGAVHIMRPALIIQMLRFYHGDMKNAGLIIRDAEEFGLLSNERVQAEVLLLYTKNNCSDAMQNFLGRIPARSANVYSVLLRHAAQHRNRAEFMELLRELEVQQVPLNDRLFSVILVSLAHFQDHDGVHNYFKKAMRSNQIHTPLFFADAGTAFARMGDMAAVDQAWNDLLQTKMVVTMPVYNRFLNIYMNQNNMTKVQEILDTMMKLVPPNPVTATTVVDMLGKMGRFSEMESILAEMIKSSNAAPTLVTYHQAMNAYAKCADVTKMEEMRERMKQGGFQANAVTYNILFEGYGRAKRFEHLQELVEERKKQNIPMEEYGYVVLLSMYAKARVAAEVEALVDEMVTSGVPLSSRLLVTAASAFCSVGNLTEMERYIELLLAHPERCLRDVESVYIIYSRLRSTVKLQELLDSPNLPQSSFIYNTCVGTFAKCGEHAKVAVLLKKMGSEGYTLNRNTSVVLSSQLLKAGKLELAQAVLTWKGLDPLDLKAEAGRKVAEESTGEDDEDPIDVDHNIREDDLFSDIEDANAVEDLDGSGAVATASERW